MFGGKASCNQLNAASHTWNIHLYASVQVSVAWTGLRGRSGFISEQSKRRITKEGSEKERGREKEGERNLVESNEASLSESNWCFNLWLRSSWCFSPRGGFVGIRAEQTFCPPMFIFTFPSYLFSARFDRRQSNSLTFAKSMSELGGRWSEVRQRRRRRRRRRRRQAERKRSRWKRAEGESECGDGVEGSGSGEDEWGLILHHNDSEAPSSP